jgi:hypothetical protein
MTHTPDKTTETRRRKSKQLSPDARVQFFLTELARERDGRLVAERERDALRKQRDTYRAHLVGLSDIERRRKLAAARGGKRVEGPPKAEAEKETQTAKEGQ